MKLSNLVAKSRKLNLVNGELEGDCVYCARHTDQGHQAVFGNNFTSYHLLQSGECVCPECQLLHAEKQFYRRSMWVATTDEFRRFKRVEAKEILLNPPEPPFAIYLTRTYKKQGWIALMDYVNMDKEVFWVACDYDILLIKLEECEKDFKLIKTLRRLKISKNEIRTGKFKAKSLEKLEGQYNIVHSVLNRVGSLLWELEVYLNE